MMSLLQGLKTVSTNHRVGWSLAQLPASKKVAKLFKQVPSNAAPESKK